MADDAIRRLIRVIEALGNGSGGKSPKKASGHDSPFPWPNDDWHCTAMHEAGHALVAWSTMTTTEVSSIVIRANGGTTRLFSKHSWLGHASARWENCATSLGGIAAECFVYGKFRSGDCASDLLATRTNAESLHVRETLRSQVVLSPPWGQPDGTSTLDFARMFTDHIPPQQLEIIRLAHCRARWVVKTHRAKLRTLALEAAKLHRLDAADIARILGPRPWAIK